MGRLEGAEPLGATPLDDISGLKHDHITTRKELYELEFANINEAVLILFTKKINIEKLFKYKYLLGIHKQMLSDVWVWAGTLRKSNKSVGIDWHQIISSLKNFEQDVLHQDKELPYLEVSARIHHKLVYIHPFENGNGRWARIVANLYLKNKVNKIIQWPDDELYISGKFRKDYIKALKDADQSHYEKLINIHKKFMLFCH